MQLNAEATPFPASLAARLYGRSGTLSVGDTFQFRNAIAISENALCYLNRYLCCSLTTLGKKSHLGEGTFVFRNVFRSSDWKGAKNSGEFEALGTTGNGSTSSCTMSRRMSAPCLSMDYEPRHIVHSSTHIHNHRGWLLVSHNLLEARSTHAFRVGFRSPAGLP